MFEAGRPRPLSYRQRFEGTHGSDGSTWRQAIRRCRHRIQLDQCQTLGLERGRQANFPENQTMQVYCIVILFLDFERFPSNKRILWVGIIHQDSSVLSRFFLGGKQKSLCSKLVHEIRQVIHVDVEALEPVEAAWSFADRKGHRLSTGW